MDLIPPEMSYALLLAFGAFAVAVHGYGLYGRPLPRPADVKMAALLESVALPYLGGPSSYNSGLLCYLAIVEFLFLVLSSSSIILELSLSVLEVDGTVGALSMSDTTTLNPMTPVLASSVIITAGNFRPFSQVENAIRRISHHVAGIPDGVYHILGRINSFPFLPKGETPVSRSVASARALGARARTASAACGLESGEAEWLGDNVMRVHALQAWTWGRDGERVWSTQSVAALRTEIARVKQEFTLFHDRLTKLLEAAGTDAVGDEEARHEEWVSLTSEALDAKNDLALLFALLVINQPDVKVPEEAGRIRALIRHIRHREERQELNVLFGATLAGLLIAAVLTTCYYLVAAGVAGLATSGALADVEPVVLLRDALARAIDSVVPFGLIFLTSTLVATGVRASRESTMQWTYWSARTLPIRQYLSLALMSALIAFLFYTLYSFYTEVVRPSFGTDSALISPSLLRDFTSQYAGYMLVPSIGLVCACAVCLVLDIGAGNPANGKSWRNSPERLALGFALLCGLLNVLVRIEGGTIESTSEALEATVVPSLVLLPCFYLFARFHAFSLARTVSPSHPSDTPRPAHAPAPRREDATVGKAGAPIALLALVLVLPMSVPGRSVAHAADSSTHAAEQVIRVGVRADAGPFSYRGENAQGETILSGYRGYMIEICRRVLRNMTASGPFEEHRVVAVRVDSRERFPALSEGRVDMLCGPDSITSPRLRAHNVSHPMFVSGITYAYVDPTSGMFSRGRRCGHIIGVVRNTTAAESGLRTLARENLLLRFDEALDRYLAEWPEVGQRIEKAVADAVAGFKRGEFGEFGSPEAFVAFDKEKESKIRELQKELAPRLKTDECPDGYPDGLPVRKYDDHDKGIARFCEGEVLYYVGDYDILRRKIGDVTASKCPVVIERFTKTKEVYGAFFRAGFRNGSMGDATDVTCRRGAATDGDSGTPCSERDDILLYTVFNHTLLRMMQADIDILEFEYDREFGESEKSADLEAFFENYRVAADIRR